MMMMMIAMTMFGDDTGSDDSKDDNRLCFNDVEYSYDSPNAVIEA